MKVVVGEEFRVAKPVPPSRPCLRYSRRPTSASQNENVLGLMFSFPAEVLVAAPQVLSKRRRGRAGEVLSARVGCTSWAEGPRRSLVVALAGALGLRGFDE